MPGLVKHSYDRSVFINCPFDAEYKPLLNAILFTVYDCGFFCAIALQDVGSTVRLHKLIELIRASRYSIHDLSRIEEPRLNMAFECGMCIGAQQFGNKLQQKKDLLLLDSKAHRYKKTMSDVAGQDAKIHRNNPIEAINCVRAFLANKSGVSPFVGARIITQRYAQFVSDLPGMAVNEQLTLDELKTLDYLPDLIALMTAWQASHPLRARAKTVGTLKQKTSKKTKNR
jgi:hypothetical protein